MKKILIIALMAVVGVMTINAQTVTPEYRKEVAKLIELTSDVNTFSDVLYSTFKTTLSNLNLPNDKLKAMSDDLAEAMYPDVIDAAVIAYSEVFTLDDLKNLNSFYNSPTGKKFAKNQARIYESTTAYLSSPAAQEKMMPIIRKHLVE